MNLILFLILMLIVLAVVASVGGPRVYSRRRTTMVNDAPAVRRRTVVETVDDDPLV